MSALPDQTADFKVIDYSVLIILLLASLAIGIYYGFFDRHEKTMMEYLMGGRRMRALPVAISLVAR